MTALFQTSTLRRAGLTALAGALALLAPAGALAQDGDQRWLPWVGCWEASDEAAVASVLCFRPDGEGVELLAFDEGELTQSDALRADGEPRSVSAEGCSGTDAVRFTDDGRRLLLTSDQSCEGGVRRTASGIISMVSPRAWIDVKAVEIEGEPVVMIQLWRFASDERHEELGMAGLTTGRERAVEAARMAAAFPPTPDEVIELSHAVHPEAVQAWLAEAADPFDLDAGLLVQLADAGVAPATIDVMVAVSYPDRFVMGREAMTERSRSGARATDRTREAMDAYGMTRPPYLHPFRWDPFYANVYGYRFGYGYGFDYGYRSNYGYGLGGYGYPYSGGWGYQPVVIVVEPDGGSRGRVVNGRGYTGGTARGAAYPRSGSGSGSARAAPPRRGAVAGSSGSGSTGSSSPPATRRAKPRGGGGGSL
jgi:hypothetical protein